MRLAFGQSPTGPKVYSLATTVGSREIRTPRDAIERSYRQRLLITESYVSIRWFQSNSKHSREVFKVTDSQTAIRHSEMFINGEFIANSSRAMIPVVNPTTEEVISEIPAGTPEDAARAVAAAEEAQKSWCKIPAIKRAGYLREIAAAIRERKDFLARTIVEEQGKILPLAEVEVDFSADYLDYMAEFARRYEGEIIQSDRPGENILLYQNAHRRHRRHPALELPLLPDRAQDGARAGHGQHHRHQAQQRNAQQRLRIRQARGPAPRCPRAYSISSTGSGSVVGKALASHPKVGMVSLTGSVEGGVAVMHAAADNVTKVSLELGGKAPAIVMQDADLDLAAVAIRASRIINTGQVCNCAERVYVHQSVAAEFTEKVTPPCGKPKVGDPLTATESRWVRWSASSSSSSSTRRCSRPSRTARKLCVGGKRSHSQARLLLPAHRADQLPAGDRHHAEGNLRPRPAHHHLRGPRRGH